VADVTVTEDGSVTAPKIIESAGDSLDRAFLDAVANWRYTPAQTNGVQVRVRIRERYTFEPTR
jgi:TonB family protein